MLNGNSVDHVLTSEGNRRDARPCQHEVRTFEQEYEELKLKKLEFENQLSQLSKGAFLKEQLRIRREFKNHPSGIAAWIDKRSEMESQRQEITAKKMDVEKRMAFIRDRAKDQKRERIDNLSTEKDPLADLLKGLLIELKGIRKDLDEWRQSK